MAAVHSEADIKQTIPFTVTRSNKTPQNKLNKVVKELYNKNLKRKNKIEDIHVHGWKSQYC
jgi:hypothetical protein